MNDPQEHMEVVNRIMRCLNITPNKVLFFKNGPRRETEIYSDADWAESVTNRR